MFRKHGKMIASVAAVAAMTAVLALTASAASTVPEIAMSAEIPAVTTVIDGPALGGINWLHATGTSVVSLASDLDGAKIVSAGDTAVVDRNANTSTLVVKHGVDADVVYAADTAANNGTILLVKADGVAADLVFAGENNNPNAPIKVVFAEKTGNVIVRAADDIELIQE